MTTRRVFLIGTVVMAMLPLAPTAGRAQDNRDARFMQSSQTACEGTYDEKVGTNFGLCASVDIGGESKSLIGAVPETTSE